MYVASPNEFGQPVPSFHLMKFQLMFVHVPHSVMYPVGSFGEGVGYGVIDGDGVCSAVAVGVGVCM